MKRVIKFRAKDIVSGDWRYGYFTEGSHGYYIADGGTGSIWQVDPKTVGQFTGLHDKNGKEIYEGDIIKKANGVWGVIVWKAPFFEVTVSETQSSLYTKEWICDSSVIGNIHQNPELLNNG